MLISSQWYTKAEAAPRFSIWYAGLGVGQIIGGIVSYAFQQVKNPEFSGWRIMFVVLGLVTVVVGFATVFFLPDTPMKARFLSEAEKVRLIRHVAVNQTGIESRKYKMEQVWEVVMDLQLWLMTLLTILVSRFVCLVVGEGEQIDAYSRHRYPSQAVLSPHIPPLSSTLSASHDRIPRFLTCLLASSPLPAH